jgi:hypothetical protein
MAYHKFNTSLEEKPRANVKSFIREVIADAGICCTGQIKHDLLHLVLTENQWNNLEFNKTQTSAGVVTKPKYVNELPERPEDTKSAAWIDYEILKDDFVAVENATKELKDKILRSIPQEDRDELEDSDYGALDLTILQIIQHLTTKYGTMERTDFETLEQQLLIPLSSQAGLPSHISMSTLKSLICLELAELEGYGFWGGRITKGDHITDMEENGTTITDKKCENTKKKKSL